ncbi:MAG: hypothetical protein KJN63_10150 [Acidimicrobiia bacterium]|nr:hypothetical protein [Acidimicrobiia bacterium]
MDVIIAIYSMIFVAFVVSTMLNVGLGTTVEHLTNVVRSSKGLKGARRCAAPASSSESAGGGPQPSLPCCSP